MFVIFDHLDCTDRELDQTKWYIFQILNQFGFERKAVDIMQRDALHLFESWLNLFHPSLFESDNGSVMVVSTQSRDNPDQRGLLVVIVLSDMQTEFGLELAHKIRLIVE